MKAYTSTPYFMAPEVLDGIYTTKWDIWSLGCVLYMLMSRKLPYQGNDTREVINKIKAGTYEDVATFSIQLKNLLKQMLNVDNEARWSAS